MKSMKLIRHLTALLAVFVVASCTLDAPVAPSMPEAQPSSATVPLVGAEPISADSQAILDGLIGVLGRTVGGLLTCEPQPFESNSAVIGRAGGTIRLGEHKLIIPAGALDRNVRITVEAPSDTVASLRLMPHGLEFDRPAQLVMSYGDCGLLAAVLNTLGLNRPVKIAYTTEQLRVLYWVRSTDDPRRRQVTGYLDHFSRYAVGW